MGAFTHPAACTDHCRTAGAVTSLYDVTKLLEKLNVTSAGLEVGLQTHSKKPAIGTCGT